MSVPLSQLCDKVSQSYIRAMTGECKRVDGINLAQGLCDLPVPPAVIEGAHKAIDEGHNSYAPAEGVASLRQTLADQYRLRYDASVSPEEVLVSGGATGAFFVTAQALLNPGDEVILFEPYYGYHNATLAMLGCPVRYVRLESPEWNLDAAVLEAAITPRTRAIVLSNPSNPSGKVLTAAELDLLAAVADKHNLVLFSDEIYEHFVYDGRRHLSPLNHEKLRDRTVVLGGFSKIFAVTGWRLGYALCPAEVAAAAAGFNDLVYVCAPTPLQLAATRGLLDLDASFYAAIAKDHQDKRDQFCGALRAAGMDPFVPQGAYYVMTNIETLPGEDDVDKCYGLLEKAGIAAVPGRAFYHDEAGRNLARFCFAKRSEVLDDACARIERLSS